MGQVASAAAYPGCCVCRDKQFGTLELEPALCLPLPAQVPESKPAAATATGKVLLPLRLPIAAKGLASPKGGGTDGGACVTFTSSSANAGAGMGPMRSAASAGDSVTPRRSTVNSDISILSPSRGTEGWGGCHATGRTNMASSSSASASAVVLADLDERRGKFGCSARRRTTQQPVSRRVISDGRCKRVRFGRTTFLDFEDSFTEDAEDSSALTESAWWQAADEGLSNLEE